MTLNVTPRFDKVLSYKLSLCVMFGLVLAVTESVKDHKPMLKIDTASQARAT